MTKIRILSILLILICLSCKKNSSENYSEPAIEQVVHQTEKENQVKEYYFIYVEAIEPRVDGELEKYSTQPTYRILKDTVDYCSPIQMSEDIMSIDQRTILKDKYEEEIQNKIKEVNNNLYRNLATSNWRREEIKSHEGKMSEGKMYIFPNYTEASEARHYFMK